LQSAPGIYRAMTAFLLLAPGTPMLFQGQEFGSTRPFLYFADHHAELAKLVSKGRQDFLRQFASLAASDLERHVADPSDADTFERCKLDWSEARSHEDIVALHRDLLRLRREDPVFRAPRPHGVDGAVLSPAAFVLRFFAADGADRLLIVNLGRDLKLREAPEPLLAAPADREWSVLWSSESWEYGGSGHAPLENDEDNWRLPGQTAVVLGASS
jgi:maltooligosyltrehalose trehalohydrolase